MTPLWLGIASFALSLAWLLPNHSQPWLGFHGDAWAACVLTAVATWVLVRTRFSVSWPRFALISLSVAAIPLLQFLVGQAVLFGIAWIHALYLLGLVLAIIVGAAWEAHSPGQAMDFLFLAVALAALVSVELQVRQLLDLEPIGPWTLTTNGSRHYANMAQPNQLASLELLGVLGCAWGYFRKRLPGVVATSVTVVILFGVVLTESRTAVLNVALLVGVLFVWRRHLPNTAVLRVVLALAFLFMLGTLALPTLYHALGQELSTPYRSALGDVRWQAWKMFLQAALLRPWFGFGWGQLAHAQFLMLDEHIIFGGSFLQSHNLLLDLVLWNGFPLGIGIGAALMVWGWKVVRRLASFGQVLMLGFLVVLGTHAMLEYPLQYAYFLLPTGLVAGALGASVNLPTVFGPRPSLTAGILIAVVAALALTVVDYFRVETSFYGLRFELKGISVPISRTPPETHVLTHWRDHIAFARMEPRSGVSSEEISRMRELVTTVPSAYVMYRFAYFLALNKQPAEAQVWLRRVCQVNPKDACTAIQQQWERDFEQDSRLQNIPWPTLH